MSSRPLAEAVSSPAGNLAPAVEFQRQWQTGRQPQIESFLSERPAISVNELAAVVRVDLRQRWRSGEQPAASDYLTRFPRLMPESALVVDLIYTEFLVREEFGERSHLSQLQQQFPQHAAELATQVEFHRALEASEEALRTDADTKQPQETFGREERPPTRLPSLGTGYEVLAEIGRGGMGVVYRARQVGLNRLVALKMVRGAEYASSELLARFRAEAEAVARLHHPQIVQIYDYGEHDGLPYLALELVEGGTLAARLNGTPWPAPQAAALVETLARAVDFAHQRGVIHRDLKPANILIAAETAELVGSGAAGTQVKITDFGLAKAFHKQSSEQTQSGALLGTPSYMAPEQAAGQSRLIGPAADVYALGAILYELLTGRPPFRGETPIATLQQVLNSEPVSISLLAPRVPRDLATICSKCLRREPEQRYRSAAELADDLARLLADQPIRARPTSSAERAWRWCRRNPALAISGGTVALLLLAVAGVSSLSSIRLEAQLEKTARAEDAERTAKLDAKSRLWDSYLAEITARTASRQIGQRSQSLLAVDNASALLPEIGRTPERVRQLRNATIAALGLPDFRRAGPAYPSLNKSGFGAGICAAADRSPVRSKEGELFVVRLSDGAKLFTLEKSGVVGAPYISPDGRFVVLHQNGAKVWRIDGSEPIVMWQAQDVAYFKYAPDGRHAAVSGAGGMRLVDLESGREVRQLGHGAARCTFDFHLPTRRIVVLGPTGFQIISWDTGEVLKEFPLPDSTHRTNNVNWVSWHDSGDYLLVGPFFAGGTALVHVDSATLAMVYPQSARQISVRFFNDGEFLFTYSTQDGSLQLWHTATGRELLRDFTFNNFTFDQSQPGNKPSNKLFRFTNSEWQVWEALIESECSLIPQGLHPPLGRVHSLDISEGGRLLAISRTKGLVIWDLVSQRHWVEPGILASQIKFTQNGDLIVSSRHSITRWPRKIQPREIVAQKIQTPPHGPAEFELEVSYGPPQQLAGPSTLGAFSMDPPGDTLLMMPALSGARVIDVDEPEEVVRLVTTNVTNRMAISSDRNWAILANKPYGGMILYNAVTGQKITDLATKSDSLPLFSPDNRWLAASFGDVRVWRVSDWELAVELPAPAKTLNGQEIAFSPDSRVLAIGQPNGVIRLTDPATGEDWVSFNDPVKSPCAFLAFSPDQSRLVTMAASEDAVPRIWNLAAIRRELAVRGLDWPSDVLQTRSNANSIDDSTRLVVTFDSGNFLQKAEARDLVSKAGESSPEQAIKLYEQAAQTDPECGLAHNEMAWILATGPTELRNADRSLEHARRAVALEPGHQGYLNTFGIALCRNAQYDEAISVLERSLALSVDDDVALDLLFLAMAHAGKNDAIAARDYCSRAKARHDSHTGNPADERDEFLRLYNEALAAIMP